MAVDPCLVYVPACVCRRRRRRQRASERARTSARLDRPESTSVIASPVYRPTSRKRRYLWSPAYGEKVFLQTPLVCSAGVRGGSPLIDVPETNLSRVRDARIRSEYTNHFYLFNHFHGVLCRIKFNQVFVYILRIRLRRNYIL